MSATGRAPRDASTRTATSGAKGAEKIADRIVEDVMERGWPVGEVLGSEAELLERYRVSRAVFREAVRLVEHQQVARTRRGPSGGLVITEPTVGAVNEAVVLYLHRVDATLDEVFEARIVLEEIASELASERLDEGDLTGLRAFVDEEGASEDTDPRTFHAFVASISRNPALELFVDVLNRVAMLYSLDWDSLKDPLGDEIAKAHARIAESVIAGNGGLARERMRKHLDAEVKFLRSRRSTRQLLPDQVLLSESNNGKGAESVARNITQTVIRDGMKPGQLVGTETELIEREGVSRALLREAVRILEHHEIARMRRGPGGGLFVARPRVNAVTDIAAIYLARRGMRLSELAELRIGVEVAIADMAASRIDQDGVGWLKKALEREAASTEVEHAEVVHDLHAAVAAAAQNRVLELVALVLIRLCRLNQIERIAPRVRERIRAEVLLTHEGIAEAVGSGDREMARHRMRRHLQALASVMS